MSARDVIAEAMNDQAWIVVDDLGVPGERKRFDLEIVAHTITDALESHGYRIVTDDLLVEHGIVQSYSDTNVVQRASSEEHSALCPICFWAGGRHDQNCKRRLVT